MCGGGMQNPDKPLFQSWLDGLHSLPQPDTTRRYNGNRR